MEESTSFPFTSVWDRFQRHLSLPSFFLYLPRINIRADSDMAQQALYACGLQRSNVSRSVRVGPVFPLRIPSNIACSTQALHAAADVQYEGESKRQHNAPWRAFRALYSCTLDVHVCNFQKHDSCQDMKREGKMFSRRRIATWISHWINGWRNNEKSSERYTDIWLGSSSVLSIFSQ